MAEEFDTETRPRLKLVQGKPPPVVDEAGAIAQSEMPFAIVEGEPVTELPRDLYIPPHALEVFLEAFEGPLDLLLYLIRRQNIDILNIPIVEITRQYVQYIELMNELQFELAGEYLLMAATLAEIKSRMLLPRSQEQQEEEDDPRADLVRRLMEYERFKKAANDIDELERLERDTVIAGADASEMPVTTSSRTLRSKSSSWCFSRRWCARRCSPTITCSVNRCRCASVCRRCWYRSRESVT
jgi:segregation and condensation protein A